jgi:hypothetical protein
MGKDRKGVLVTNRQNRFFHEATEQEAGEILASLRQEGSVFAPWGDVIEVQYVADLGTEYKVLKSLYRQGANDASLA